MDHERIIHILDYLSRHTDESHFVTINQIQDYLANVCNLSRVKSVTIRRDLDRLTTMGNNIIKVNHEHNTAYYALIDKGFSFNEIRFIVDSISINKFLTAHQKQKLIKKFEGMCSDTEIRQLISRIVLNERCPSTLDLLENLDKIHRLIGERRKIDFDYVVKKYKLRPLRFHDLRHSCASLLLANGVSMKAIQDWLGHSTFNVTANFYSHLDYKSRISSAEVISNALGDEDDENEGKKKTAGS